MPAHPPLDDDHTPPQRNQANSETTRWSQLGRLERGSFVRIFLFSTIYLAVVTWIALDQFPSLETNSEKGNAVFAYSINLVLVGIFGLIPITIERLHDLERSGWYAAPAPGAAHRYRPDFHPLFQRRRSCSQPLWRAPDRSTPGGFLTTSLKRDESTSKGRSTAPDSVAAGRRFRSAGLQSSAGILYTCDPSTPHI